MEGFRSFEYPSPDFHDNVAPLLRRTRTYLDLLDVAIMKALEKKSLREGLHVYPYSRARVPLEEGVFSLTVYRNNRDELETLVLSQGLFSPRAQENNPLVKPDQASFLRLHSECMTGDVFGSLVCDCGLQLKIALREIEKRGRGLIIYLRQEGRGIGLGNKLRAYSLQQNEGLNTVEANQALGFPSDLRNYDIPALILKEVGCHNVILNTNNPDKIAALEKHGIKISGVEPSIAPLNKHNVNYMKTKKDLMGHRLGDLSIGRLS